jgi:hypothetical protein
MSQAPRPRARAESFADTNLHAEMHFLLDR